MTYIPRVMSIPIEKMICNRNRARLFKGNF